MDLPTTAQVDASLKTVLDAAGRGKCPVADIDRVRTWAKGFEVLVRAYYQGGLPQLGIVFEHNFEDIKATMDARRQAEADEAGEE